MSIFNYKFENIGGSEFNDTVFDQLFALNDYSYKIRIKPSTTFWRFGIRFSQSDLVSFFHPSGRYNDAIYPNIEFVAGDIPDPSRTENPDHLHLSGYWMPGHQNSYIFHHIENYTPMDVVELGLSYDEKGGILALDWQPEHGQALSIKTTLPGYKYFKLFAWADWHAYQIDCTITTRSIFAAPTHQYWVLKLDTMAWNINEFKVGFTSTFGTYLPETLDSADTPRPRPEHERYLQVKEGDRLLGYEFRNLKSIVCLFEATGAASGTGSGEYIGIRVVKMLDPHIAIAQFQSVIAFADELSENARERLFRLPVEAYLNILSLTSAILDADGPHPRFLPFYLSEGNHDQPDQLGFDEDIAAVAAVIGMKDVQPPLAVGLFGKWGAGKSFFMHKLQLKIDSLGIVNPEKYCQKVLPIQFNSWHYSDANLWASLIAKIFDELKKYGQLKEPTGQVETLFRQLNTTKEILADRQSDLKAVDQKIGELKKEKEIVDKSIAKKTERLSGITTLDIAKAITKDPQVTGQIDDLKREYKFLNLKSHDIEENLAKLNDGVSKFQACLQFIFSLRTNGRKWWIAILFLLVILLIYFLLKNAGWIKQLSTPLLLSVSAALALFGQLMIYLKPAFKAVNSAFEKMTSIKNLIENLKQTAREHASHEAAEVNQNLEKEQAAALTLQNDIDMLTVKKESIETEIADISTGRKIVKFIEDRVADAKYQTQLGIVSWIRKDFEELDFLLKQQHDAQKLAESGRSKVDNVFTLERIVLYIDDLDRCDDGIVVKVLEAIHLLLAFPLFVVIVGVDPEWMNKALKKRYTYLSLDGFGMQPQLAYDPTSPRPATTYDYLEKIFQIPFALKPIGEEPGKELIKQLLAKELANQVAFQQPAADTPVAHKNTQTSPNTSAKPTPPPSPTDPPPKEPRVPAEDEPLRITTDELNFMQKISPIFAQTPRHVNRYVNIYRILKSHAGLKINSPNEPDEYYLVMFLLAIIVGYNEQSVWFFRSIQHSQTTKTLNDLLIAPSGETPAPNPNPKPIPLPVGIIQSTLDAAFLQKPLKDFLPNLELVSRFSFRAIKL